LPYDSLGALRAAMIKAHPSLGRLDAVEPAGNEAIARLAATVGAVSAEPFRATVADFFMTNPIARASAVMAELSALKAGKPSAQAAE
jgi:NADH-quinone oxidoreductase subunit G